MLASITAIYKDFPVIAGFTWSTETRTAVTTTW